MKIESICHVETTDINCMPRVWREAISAKEAGFSVTVIGEGENSIYEGIEFIGFPKKKRFNRIFIRSKKMLKQAISTGAQIIQIHSPEFLLHFRYLKRRKKIVIFDSHEFYGIQINRKNYLPLFVRKILSNLYKKYEKHVCNNIDCVLYPCTIDGLNYFENRAKLSFKIENFSKEISKATTFNDKKDNYVIYAGSLTPDRGITILANSIKRTDCNLLLCGQFLSKEYENDILSISDKIIYKGLVKRSDLFALYSKAIAGVSTLLPVGQYSMLDNMSTKVYEYMQNSLPVIMSNFKYYKKMNDLYSFGICVDPENPDEIVSAIQFLLNNPNKSKEMGLNGCKAINNHFNWDTESKKLIDIYNYLLYHNNII